MCEQSFELQICCDHHVAIPSSPVEDPRVTLQLLEDLIMSRNVEAFGTQLLFEFISTKISVQQKPGLRRLVP